MKVFVVLLVLMGFVGVAFATHDPDKSYTHPIRLPDMQEKTFEEFMNWCVPFYGEKCTELYHGTSTLPPLKQIQSGVKFHNVECKKGMELVYKKTDDTSACVTLLTKIELVVRGWAEDNRVLLGCKGDRVQKCYPEDPFEYRKTLYGYYFGDDKELPSSDDYEFESLHTTNACTDKPRVCFGEFDNGTKIRTACDYPNHGCGVMSFNKDNYKADEEK